MLLTPPPYTALHDIVPALAAQGEAVLSPEVVSAASGCALSQLNNWLPLWNDLPPDQYLKDGGRYRRRRHSCFTVDAQTVTQVPHRAHWQSEEYNALHGGMERWFEPMSPDLASAASWQQLLRWLGQVFSSLKPGQPWYVEAHQFRIDTTDGIGRPTPEGAHRDGVDFVAVFLLARHHIKGGETRVFEAHGTQGQRFTLQQPWSVLLLDDERVIHESTPIQPTGEGAYRDTLVLTYRLNGFQGQA